ncbi:MAG TPA: hypothetical protein DF863_07390 [Gammaproteobacteria bacterium]|nr:hypothetical protein [Gammaproteobacteria bacterium]
MMVDHGRERTGATRSTQRALQFVTARIKRNLVGDTGSGPSAERENRQQQQAFQGIEMGLHSVVLRE